MISSTAFIEEVRQWIGVDFLHQGRTSNGVDCIGILIASAERCGLNLVDDLNYAPRADREAALQMMRKHGLYRVQEAMPGDILHFSYFRQRQHYAIVSRINPIYIIHALSLGTKKVSEQRLDENMRKTLQGIYRHPEVVQDE